MSNLLIVIFLGPFGIHKFMQGKPRIGILYLCTFGLFGIGWIIDIIFAANKLAATNKGYNTPATQDFSDPVLYIHSSKDTQKNMRQIAHRFIVFDTETTGLNFATDRIISIAAILFVDGKAVDSYYSLVNPSCHIPSSATQINGITDNMVASAPYEADMCHQFANFIGDALSGKTLMVAYNSLFDAKFLKAAMERSGIGGNIRHFDVLAFARKKLVTLPNHKLSTVAAHLAIDTQNAHNSMRDSEMCAQVLLKLM